MLSNLIRRMRGKPPKKRRLPRLWSLAIVLPVTAILSLMFAFFMFDSFNYYVLLLIKDAQDDAVYRSQVSQGILDWDSWEGQLGTGGNTELVPGAVGVRAMYINKMSGGYYKETLEIVRDHCNWSKMNDNVEPVQKDGVIIYPSVSTILGLQLSEGGLENESGERVSTVSVLSRNHYSTSDGKHSLSTYNSAVAAADGGSTMSSGYNGNMDLYYNGGSVYRTHMQYTANYAALYPSGRYVAEAAFWPSKMNGYGIDQDKVRTKADTDAAYYPDDVSIAMQRAWCALDGAPKLFNHNTLSDTSLGIAMYAAYGYGETGMAYQWGVGSPSGSSSYTVSGWNSKNTISFADNTSTSINFVADAAEKVLKGLVENYDAYTDGLWDTGYYPYVNHEDYRGIAVTSMLLSGCFPTPSTVDTIHAAADSGSFVRGATIAYRIFKNDASISTETVAAWLRGIEAKSIDTSKYPGYKDTLLHYLDSSCMIYQDNGAGPYPALRSYSSDIRGMFMVHIGGVMIYWNMLKAAGVECTFGDAYRDVIGAQIVQSPSDSGSSGGSTGSSSGNTTANASVGVRMARCMASYSYATKEEGLGNNGTDLYIRVHDMINASDVWYMSCDRGVACATRWAGADDNIPLGSTYNQLQYFDKGGGGHWVRVDWGGNQANLQPGDILIRSDRYRKGIKNGVGHIVMYCGWEIISEYHPDAKKNSVIAHASFRERSPTCGVWYSTLNTFEVYRNIQPEAKSRYANVIPYV